MSSRRRNPDPDMRRLERAAAAGDPEALARLQRARGRAGIVRGRLYSGVHTSGVSDAVHMRDAHGGPLRAPHYTASARAMAEEVDLARGGILVLDEINSFSRRALRAIHERLVALGSEAPYVFAIVRDEQGRVPERLPAWVRGLEPSEQLLRMRPKKKNPDPKMRRLERAAAAGDQDARVELARRRLRAGQATAEDLWAAVVHDIALVVQKKGWIVADPILHGRLGPWGFVRVYSKPVSESKKPGHEDVGVARVTVGLGTRGYPVVTDWGVVRERFWPAIDAEFEAEVRAVLAPHFAGVEEIR